MKSIGKIIDYLWPFYEGIEFTVGAFINNFKGGKIVHLHQAHSELDLVTIE